MRHVRRIGLLGLVIGVAMLLEGCTRSPRPIASDPDFRGRVTEIEPGGTTDPVGRILVESLADEPVDKHFVTVQEDTRVFMVEGQRYRLVSFYGLTVGDEVQLWYTGPILESFPAQATAKQVVILESAIVAQATASPPSTTSVPATLTLSPSASALTSTPSPQVPEPTGTPTYLGVVQQGGELGEVWNLADVRYGVHPDRVRVVVEMVEARDHVPLYQVVEEDNDASPFPTGHDPSWGAARIDLVVSDLYAYDSPVFEQLPMVPQDNPRVTQIGHYPTFDDSSLGFSIGLTEASAYEVYELTDPVRIVIDVLW